LRLLGNMLLRVADPVISYLRTQTKVNAVIKIDCLAIYLALINLLFLAQSLGHFLLSLSRQR
nr:hypothetical protein [Shewanella sp.]